MTTDMVKLLFGAYRRALLACLLLRPDESFYVRELARLTGYPAGTLHRELKQLEAAGLLHARRVGNQVHYQANRESPIFDELAGILRKTADPAVETSAEVPVAYATRQLPMPPQDTLRKLCRRYHVSTLSLFGSAARGQADYGSDVDLLVEFEPGHAPGLARLVKFKTELAGLFGGRKVDVVTAQSLDNPYRRKAILSDQRVLYAA